MPKISVIIPLYDAEKYIEECLNSIIKAPPKDKEIIVVNNNSTDKGPELVSKFKVVKLVNETKKGPSAARNKGIKESSGDILLFLDDDLIVDKNYINEIVKTFDEDRKIVCVGGIAHSYNQDSIISLSHEVRLMGYSPSHSGVFEVKTIPTMTFSTLRKVIEEVGLFDEDLIMAEDYDLCIRIRKKGYKCVMNSKAIVYHHNPTEMKSLIRRWYKYGIWWTIANKKHNILGEILNSIIWFFVLLIAIILSFVNYKFIFAAIFIFILPWVVYYSIDTSRYLTKSKKLHTLVFPFIHQTLIVSRVIGILKGTIKITKK